MGFSGFFFGHQWDPLEPITDAMTEIGILSGLFGSLTPLRAVFFKDDLIERSTILDFVHFLRSNPQIYEKFEYETIFPNYN